MVTKQDNAVAKLKYRFAIVKFDTLALDLCTPIPGFTGWNGQRLTMGEARR